jgi:hypothetical protein
MRFMWKYFRTRLPVILALTAIATVYVAVTSDFEADSPLAEQISTATGLHISPDSVRFIEPFDAANLHSATRFHELAFLATDGKSPHRDLYLAKVKLSPGPGLIDVSSPINLTHSDAGDDYLFEIRRHLIIVSTRVLGQVRSLTIFDLRGVRFPEDEDWDTLQRTLARLTDFQKTGRWKGIAKTTVRFDNPARNADFSVVDTPDQFALSLRWTDSSQTRHAARVNLNTMKTADPGIQVLAEVRLPKRPVLWTVDTVRSLDWIGPGPIEWAEGRFFAMKDRIHQLKYSISGDDESNGSNVFAATPRHIELKLPEGTEVGDYNPLTWPPEELEAPVFSRKKTGEGEWIPADPDFVKTLPNAPPSIYKTYIRTDRSRPYTHVNLYAMDTRQLSLHMVGGHEDPISTTGEVGTGQLPRDKETIEKIALVFNGAFKTIHGEYGMMADRTVLLPPKDEAATVATDNDGRVALGTWPAGQEIPDTMVSFRQNMDPLLENGVVNPKRRYLWGFTLGSDISQMNTIRSGLCIRDDGILIYAWGDDLTAITLGEAMRAAKCSYGIHLDMNPFHTSFVAFQMTWRGDDVLPKFEYRKLIKDIRFWPDRYVHGAPKDFFYMTLRDTTPPGQNWTTQNITQPAPAFLPAIFKREKSSISMLAIDSDAVQPILLPGVVPGVTADGTHSVADNLPDDLNLVGEMLLGKWSSNRGQMTGGTIVATLKPDAPTLYLDADGAMHIAAWNPAQLRTQNAIQGEWLIRNGEISGTRGEILAVGRLDKWIYVARGNGATVAAEFMKMGIRDAILFDGDNGDILLRSSGRMTTIDGTPRTSRDISLAALRFSARARGPFGTRLSEFFPSAADR